MGDIVNIEDAVILAGEKSDQEWINEGIGIRKQAEQTTRSLGEWYVGVANRKLDASSLSIEILCEQATIRLNTARSAANFIKCFSTEESQQGFGIHECIAMLPIHRKLGDDEFHGRFMSDAKAGIAYKADTSGGYIYTGPYTDDDIARQKQWIVKLELPSPKSPALEAHTEAISEKLSEVLDALPKSTKKKVKGTLTKIIKEEERVLAAKFEDDVLQGIDEKIAPIRDKMRANLEKAKELEASAKDKEERLSYRLAGVPAFMDIKEYKLICGCLHPDRAPKGQEARFKRAFEIMRRIGKGIE
jgi:hypothetical protein